MQIGAGRDVRVHGTGTAVDSANRVHTYNIAQSVGGGRSLLDERLRMACTNDLRKFERYDLFAKVRA